MSPVFVAYCIGAGGGFLLGWFTRKWWEYRV